MFFCLAVEAYVRAMGCTAIDMLVIQLWLLVTAAVEKSSTQYRIRKQRVEVECRSVPVW